MAHSAAMPVPSRVSQQPALYRLPLELRYQIYTHILSPNVADFQDILLRKNAAPWVRSLWASKPGQTAPGSNGILRVSQRISREALDVLYGSTQFIITLDEATGPQLARLGIGNLQRIRSLRLVVLFRPGFPPRLDFDPALWTPLLSNLRDLCLVIQQPQAARTHFGAPLLEHDLRQWSAWIDPVLRQLAASIPEHARVELDSDDRTETTDVVRKHIGARYKSVCTDTGDRIFGRAVGLCQPEYMDSSDVIPKVLPPSARVVS
jgi:hypothetical protein